MTGKAAGFADLAGSGGTVQRDLPPSGEAGIPWIRSIMRKKSVVILSPSLQAVSGVSTHANMLYGSSLAHEFDLMYFQVGSEGRRESAARKALRFLLSPWQFLLFLLRRRPDIVHINSSMDQKAFWRDFFYLMVAKMLGRKVISQFHGGELPQALFPHGRVRGALLRRFMNWSDVVVVLSQEELRCHQAFSPAAKFIRIPNAIMVDGLLDPIAPADPAQPLKLVFVGRLAREKGVFEAVEALPLLRVSGRQVELQIAGAGPDESELRTLASRLGVESMVKFVGPIFGAAKSRFWASADVFVFPTFHKEGLPYALLEAMAAGTPPVTCAVAAIPDVMIDGVHGLFVPSKDAQALATGLARLYDDRGLLRRMAQAGRDRVLENYTVARLATDFRGLYSAL
jgi:glycosyltransferase involved in cell wall biosynthesis